VTIVNNVIALHTKIQCNNSSFFGRGLIRKGCLYRRPGFHAVKEFCSYADTALEVLRLKFDGSDLMIIK
jgi:hypothetical protein